CGTPLSRTSKSDAPRPGTTLPPSVTRASTRTASRLAENVGCWADGVTTLPSSTAALIITSRRSIRTSDPRPHVVEQPIDFTRLCDLVDPPRIGELEIVPRQLQHAVDRLPRCRTIAGLI